MRIAFAVIGLAALTVACSNGEMGASGSPRPSGSPNPADPALAAIVDPVLADAAARLSVDVAEVRLSSVEAVTWSDGSLGCPRPGELYTQALVDGHRILVSAAGTTLDYRVTGPGAFRVCNNPPASEP